MRGEIEIDVDVSEQLALGLGFALQTGLRNLEPLRITILRLTCELLSDRTPAASEEAPVLGIGNWLPFLSVGVAGVRRNGRISTTGRPGYLLYGPYWALPPGEYEAVFKLEVDAAGLQGTGAMWRWLWRVRARWSPPVSEIVCSFEAFSEQDYLGLTVLRLDDMRKQNRATVIFMVTAERAQDPGFALELQVLDKAILPYAINEVEVRRLGDPGTESDIDWLKLMTVGPAGLWDKGQILLQRGIRGLVARSPDLMLREGRYELSLELVEAIGVDGAGVALLTLLVMSCGRLRASCSVSAEEITKTRQVVAFEVRNDEAPEGRLPVELHILSSGAVVGVVRGIVMRRVGASTGALVWLEQINMDWTPWLAIGPAGNWTAGGIAARAEAGGNVVHGPSWKLTPGRYRMTVYLAQGVAQTGVCGTVDVVDQVGALVIAEKDFDGEHLREGIVRLPFTIGPEGGIQVETRVWKVPQSSFVVTHLLVEQV